MHTKVNHARCVAKIVNHNPIILGNWKLIAMIKKPLKPLNKRKAIKFKKINKLWIKGNRTSFMVTMFFNLANPQLDMSGLKILYWTKSSNRQWVIDEHY